MYYFPRRPVNRRRWVPRRFFQDQIARYEDVVVHFRADECYVDGTTFQVRCAPGDLIGAVRNLTDHENRHAVPVLPSIRMTYVIDSGFPAIFTGQGGQYDKTSNARILRTPTAFACAMEISVIRSATSGWANYGQFLGASAPWNARPYLTSNSGTGWFQAPISVQRQNGVNQTPGSSLAQSISQPFVITIGHREPGMVYEREIGTATDLDASTSYNAGLYIYETLGFSSVLPIDDIVAIETFLMDYYGIS